MNAEQCETTPLGRSVCAEYIRVGMAVIGAEHGEGCDVIVSTRQPLVATAFNAHGYICRHGVTYWVEPTREQIVRWNQARTP